MAARFPGQVGSGPGWPHGGPPSRATGWKGGRWRKLVAPASLDLGDRPLLSAASHNPRSSRRPRALVAAAASLLSVCLAGAPARAQSDADRATARALAEEGFEALQEEDYATAEDRFRRADALVHAPTLVVDRGRALLGMKRYVEAQEQFELVLREGVPEGAPPSWAQAVQEAHALLDEVKPKIAWLTVSVPDVPHAEIRVDGQPIPRAAQGVRRATNPGRRTIEVVADGYRSRRLQVDLPEGGEVTRVVTLEALPRRQPAATNPTDQRPGADGSDDRRRPATYAAFGVGGAGLLLGSVTGILALQRHAELTELCPEGLCPASQASAIDGYHRLSWTSGVGFALGLAGTATGVVFWLGQRQPAAAEHAAPSRLRLDLAPGEVRLRASF